jgi:uroporphyrinogen-III synthase
MAQTADSRPSGAGALAGRTVVVTRPERQAGALAELIRKAGGTAVVFPLLDILDIDDTAPILALIGRLAEFDLAVFISPNAVQKAMDLIGAHGGLPRGLRVATVGKGSAAELRRLGIADVIAPPERFDSEALLALPEMRAVAGQRIVIFRGVGGREVLGDTLAARGAIVEYAACYHRSKPGANPSPLFRLWMQDQLSAFVITSSEGLRNLFDIVGPAGRARLEQTLLFVPHPRVAETAHALGSTRVVLTGPNDQGVLAGMVDWWSKSHAPSTPF